MRHGSSIAKDSQAVAPFTAPSFSTSSNKLEPTMQSYGHNKSHLGHFLSKSAPSNDEQHPQRFAAHRSMPTSSSGGGPNPHRFAQSVSNTIFHAPFPSVIPPCPSTPLAHQQFDLSTSHRNPAGSIPGFFGHFYSTSLGSSPSEVLTTTDYTFPAMEGNESFFVMTQPTTDHSHPSNSETSLDYMLYHTLGLERQSPETAQSVEDDSSQAKVGNNTDLIVPLPYQNQKLATPQVSFAKPVPFNPYSQKVPPGLLHRREIGRKARDKQRKVEMEVHELLTSKGIILRGRANVLKALLELYKQHGLEIDKLKGELERHKGREERLPAGSAGGMSEDKA